jgi:4-amino-4-deoxy-L-arabinose transferase-like glycosyltransferase
MINPAKASYSIAPTMVVCALAGLLTAKLFVGAPRHRIRLTILLGLFVGLSVNFRLPNLFLSAGYFLFLFACFVRMPSKDTLLQGASFALAFLVGMAPTLLANAINAGSPLATTYGGGDAVPPELSLGIIWQYVADMQFVLLALAIGWTALILRWRHESGIRQLAWVTAGNLLVNLAFFFSHPLFTPYYTVPVAMLSLWSLLFGSLLRPTEVVDDAALEQAAKA